jgi:hypothetical protein
MSLSEILEGISLGTWFVDLVAIILLYKVYKQDKDVNSSLLTMVVVVIANTVMIGHEAIINAYQGPEPKYNSYVVFAWFTGRLILYYFATYWLRAVHTDNNLKIGTLGAYVNNAYIGFATLQVLQYSEIVIFKTNMNVAPIYSVGMPAIGITATAVSLYIALYGYYYLRVKKVGKESLKWNI